MPDDADTLRARLEAITAEMPPNAREALGGELAWELTGKAYETPMVDWLRGARPAGEPGEPMPAWFVTLSSVAGEDAAPPEVRQAAAEAVLYALELRGRLRALPEWPCPHCGAVTRARMADRDEAGALNALRTWAGVVVAALGDANALHRTTGGPELAMLLAGDRP